MSEADDEDPSQPVLPPGVGPHEERELELMLAGAKPLAMFSDIVPASFELPEADFQPHVDAGTLVRREEFYSGVISSDEISFVYYALPGEAWRIDEMHAMNDAFYDGSKKWHQDDDRRVGELLGYTPDEIESFIAHAGRIRRLGTSSNEKDQS